MMVELFAFRCGTVGVPAPRDVDLTTDDRFDALLQGCFVKAHRPKQVPMIRDRGGRHFQFCDPVHNCANFTGTVKKAVVSVKMKMNEFALIHDVLLTIVD
jgi:hypothetical protein